MPIVDIQLSIECDGWPESAVLEALCRKTVTETARYLAVNEGQPFPDGGSELSLLFTGDAAMRAINQRWRGRDKATNVLSFPACPLAPGDVPGPVLGDVLFALETVRREAESLDISFDAHLTHLLVHGFLHLIGYDHDDDSDAETMEGLETRILAALNLSDPYENSDPV